MRRTFLFLMMIVFVSLSMVAEIQVVDLRCEGLTEPLGINTLQPHFSWKYISEEPIQQTAYEIQVASSKSLLEKGLADQWTSGIVRSSASVMVTYSGNALIPRQQYWWRVRVVDDKGISVWSQPQRFGVGIIDGDMQGAYITMAYGQSDATLFRKSFKLKNFGTALLHVNSLGYHEVYVNGVRVGNAVLSPAVSQLDKRSQIVTYDITSLLRKGTNSLVLSTGSGWYKKESFEATCDGPAVRAELDLIGVKGISTVLTTDGTWQGCRSGYFDTCIWTYMEGGERIDASMVPADMTDATLSALPWEPVQEVAIEGITATPQMCGNTIIKETHVPVSIESLGNHEWLIDMGKAMNAFFEIHLPALSAGQEVVAFFGDHLDENGIMSERMFKDTYISSGNRNGDTFCNRFNHHCFRYVLVRGLDECPDRKGIKAHRIAMDVATTATFLSSDPDLNAVHDMLSYTMSCLAFCGYMVDCAHFERLGYGGDGNASTLSLQNMYDVAPLYQNWLQAWVDAQQPDGGLPHTAPCPFKAGGGPYWCSFIVQAPWRTWMDYGDDRQLYRCYPSMKQWLKYVDTYTQDGLLRRWPDTDYRSWYLGDWLAGGGVDVVNEESVTLVNNCALSQSYTELIAIARYMGLNDDAEAFEQRREALNKRIHEQFFHTETNTYGMGTQLDMCYPLLTGVVPDALVDAVTRSLIVRTDTAYHDHLAVGLVGVPIMAEYATLHHQSDLVYRMLKQKDYPGYLYMINQGATATWEDWDKPRSYIHNCYNGMDSWFIQALGGIIPVAPGYRTTLIDPQIPEGLNWVRVTRDTPYGTIQMHWHRTDDGVAVHVVIPNGITAVIDGKLSPAGTYDYTIVP